MFGSSQALRTLNYPFQAQKSYVYVILLFWLFGRSLHYSSDIGDLPSRTAGPFMGTLHFQPAEGPGHCCRVWTHEILLHMAFTDASYSYYGPPNIAGTYRHCHCVGSKLPVTLQLQPQNHPQKKKKDAQNPKALQPSHHPTHPPELNQTQSQSLTHNKTCLALSLFWLVLGLGLHNPSFHFSL